MLRALYENLQCMKSYFRGCKQATITSTSLHSLQLQYSAIHHTSLYHRSGPRDSTSLYNLKHKFDS